MDPSLPTRILPEHPDLDQLKRQAKELLDAFLAGEPNALAIVNGWYRDADAATFALHDAQLVIARSHAFESWPKLKAYVDGVTAKRFQEAVRAGSLAEVREMLRVRPELVNQKLSGLDDRALHHAVLERRPEMVRLLMEYGADAHAGMWMHAEAPVTPLGMAVERGYPEIVAIIGEQAPAVEPAPAAAPPHLMQALRRSDQATMIAYLESNRELIHQGDAQNGMTPLHYASAFLLEKLAVWLLDRGADLNTRNKDGNTPLDVAGCGNGRSTSGLSKQADRMRETLLARGAERTARWAVITGNAEWLRARHAEGTLGNPVYDGEGLLSLAVTFDRPEMVALLLDLGFDPDERRRLDLEPAQDSWGQPLRHCAKDGKLAMAEMLLARGADPNASIYAAGTPLYVGYGNPAMRELLQQHGGYLNAEFVGSMGLVDKAKEMLADEAAGCLRKEAIPDHAKGRPVAELLLASGTHPEILPMALARITRRRDDPWWFHKLSESRLSEDLKYMRLVLTRCDANVRADLGGQTVLHQTAGGWPRSMSFTGEQRVAQATVLLDAGARLDLRDDYLRSTPLGWACRWGRVELVKLFLDRGADPVEEDSEPWARPRAWAERMKHDDVLALLREVTR